MLVIFCVYKIVYLIQFLYLNIAFLFTCVDLARAIDHRCHWPLQSTSYRQLRASHTFLAGPQTLNNYQIYLYGMDFSVSSINFMISMRSFSFMKIFIRLSKWLKLKMALVLFSRSYLTQGWIVYSCTTGHDDMIISLSVP